MPLFSIITVTYNAEKYIEQSIKAVLEQDADYEYIIVDGGSTDGTLDIINKFRSEIDIFISEKDNGIYDAMNKGLDLSTGDYILFIGADDKLYDKSTLHTVSDYLSNEDFDFVSGSVRYASGNVFRSKFNLKTLLNNTLHHQSTFYNKRLFVSFRFDIQYKLIADYELNLQLYLKRANIKFLFIDDFISLCGDGGVSRTLLKKAQAETNSVRKKVIGSRDLGYRVLYNLKFFITTKLLP